MIAITDDIKKLLSVTDLVLLDIKHIDEKKCKDLVGFSNKLELEFAKYLLLSVRWSWDRRHHAERRPQG